MLSNQIAQTLSSILTTIKFYHSISIGDLVQIIQIAEKQTQILEDKTLANAFIQYMMQVYERSKSEQAGKENISILALQSMLYNIYRNLNNQKMLSNSLYNNNSQLMSSTSQLSMNQQSIISNGNQLSYENTSSLGPFTEDFISDKKLLKKLQIISSKRNKKGQNVNQRYVQILMETIQYILQKQGKIDNQKNDFYQRKKSIVNSSVGHHTRNLKTVIEKVNQIIFSNKLNRILFLLEQAEQSVYFSLLRIYMCEIHQFRAQMQQKQPNKQKSKKYYNYFRKIKYRGQQMVQNICYNYINSVESNQDLFIISKNPFYKLISHYFLCFFLPHFRKFMQIIIKCMKIEFKNRVDFYKQNQSILNKDLLQFIQDFPSELTQYLRNLYQLCIIADVSRTSFDRKQISHKIPPLICIKKLLLYSFLGKSEHIKIFLPQSTNLQKYAECCTYIVHLFFDSSLKSPQNEQLSADAYQLISTLTTAVNATINQKIIPTNQQNFYSQNNFQVIKLSDYLIEQPLLNHDYQSLYEWINSLEFSPKDEKDFEMKTLFQINKLYDECENKQKVFLRPNDGEMKGQPYSFSPMNKFKKQNIEVESIQLYQSPKQQQNQIDFLTWMSVGGSCEYNKAPKISQYLGQQIAQRSDKKKHITNKTTFKQSNIKEIKSFYKNLNRLQSGIQ